VFAMTRSILLVPQIQPTALVYSVGSSPFMGVESEANFYQT
jgi:hypothetical protein